MSENLWVPGEIDTAEMFDAAFCPAPVPAGFPACMVYAGGSSASHPWTARELALVAHLPRLPVWVPTPGTDNPRQAGLTFVAWLAANKVPAVAPKGEHTPGMWDLETGRVPYPRWGNNPCKVLKAHRYFNPNYARTLSDGTRRH